MGFKHEIHPDRTGQASPGKIRAAAKGTVVPVSDPYHGRVIRGKTAKPRVAALIRSACFTAHGALQYVGAPSGGIIGTGGAHPPEHAVEYVGDLRVHGLFRKGIVAVIVALDAVGVPDIRD